MAYKIEYAKGVVKDLKKLPTHVKQKALMVVEKILARNPLIGKKLTGPYKGMLRYRIGDYRIIYSIEKQRLVIFVLRIRHRKNAYDGIAF